MATLLVVDDDPAVGQVLHDLLMDDGHRVLVVTDGHMAIAALAIIEVDVVLCDLMMPRMSGIVLVTRIRAQALTATLPVILISAAPEQNTLLPISYLTLLEKPFTADSLFAAVAEALAAGRDP